MKLKANAKVNWSLEVVNKRSDGYHNLDMVIQSINLSDYITINESSYNTVKLVNNPSFNFGKNNICLKAIELFNQITGYSSSFSIQIEKNIPVGGGLGGGSSNGAAILYALNKIYKTNMNDYDLQQIGLKIGSDIPFMIVGGLAKVEGIGELITPFKDTNKHALLIINNRKEILTKEIFANHIIKRDEMFDSSKTIENLLNRKYSLLKNSAGNSLQVTTTKLLPEISYTINDLYENGAIYATMSGSGSTVFGVFDNLLLANNAKLKLENKWKICEVCETSNYGIKEII